MMFIEPGADVAMMGACNVQMGYQCSHVQQIPDSLGACDEQIWQKVTVILTADNVVVMIPVICRSGHCGEHSAAEQLTGQ